MKKFFGVASMAALLAVGSACDKNDKTEDTVNPEINSVSVNGEDHDLLVWVGSTLQIEAEVSDNQELGELKIDVHDVFDGHSHGRKSVVRWAQVKTVQLSGTTQQMEETLQVPQDAAAGPYHMVFRLIDEVGNEAEFVELEMMVKNSSQPVIGITSPDFTDEVHAPKGSTLSLEGSISDDVDLAEVIIRLAEAHDHEHKSTMDEPLYENEWELTGSADLLWDLQTDGNVDISIPATAEEGHYLLEVIAIDSDGNMNIFEEEVHVM